MKHLIHLRYATCGIFLVLLAGCASPMQRMMSNYPRALQSLPDPALAVEALPQQIVLVEAILIDDPENADLLRAASGLYLMYIQFQNLPQERARRLATRASTYARRALDATHPEWGGFDSLSYDGFENALAGIAEEDLDLWFDWASARMIWISLHPDHPYAQADLPRVTDVLKRLIAVDPGFRDGFPHLYLGAILAIQKELEKSREHFEALFEQDNPEILPMAKFLYATVYLEAAKEPAEQRSILEDLAREPDPLMLEKPEPQMRILIRRKARQALDDLNDPPPEAP